MSWNTFTQRMPARQINAGKTLYDRMIRPSRVSVNHGCTQGGKNSSGLVHGLRTVLPGDEPNEGKRGQDKVPCYRIDFLLNLNSFPGLFNPLLFQLSVVVSSFLKYEFTNRSNWVTLNVVKPFPTK